MSESYDANYYKGPQYLNTGSFTYEDNLKNAAFNLQSLLGYLMPGNPAPFSEVSSILDLGASGGFFMKHVEEYAAIRDLSVELFGVEPSEFARENNCLTDKGAGQLFDSLKSFKSIGKKVNLVTSFFVLEHIEKPALIETLGELNDLSKMLYFRVPLLNELETPEDRASYDPDPTHVTMMTFDGWREFLWEETDWYLVSGSYSNFGHEKSPGPVGSFFCVKEDVFEDERNKELVPGQTMFHD